MTTRNLDLIRDLLIHTSREEFTSDDPTVIHHADLLRKAGFIQAVVTPPQWRGRFQLAIFKRLTPAGRQFLFGIRDDVLWERTKRAFVRPGLVFSLPCIAQYVRATINQHRADQISGHSAAPSQIIHPDFPTFD